jgi:gliding motility-associated-like protein
LVMTGGIAPYTYTWSNDTITTNNYLYNLKWGVYYISIQDSLGCSTKDTVEIGYAPCCSADLPNAFSPNNGDDLNDVFRPVTAAGYEIIKFLIYDRWGNQVFFTNDVNAAWDGTYKGTPMDMDTYFVLFTYRCLWDSKVYTVKKDLMLVR